MRSLVSLCFAICTASASFAQDKTQDTKRDVMVVFDMSGSMWGQVDGVAKVEIARDAFSGLLTDWAANDTQTGLIAYGHRRRGDCGDIEVMARPGDGNDIGALVAGLRPVGKTPLSDAVSLAANVLKYTEEAATVVLLSDGVETCEADPCSVGAELEALGLDFTAHVIGFDIAEGDRDQLQCLADATGGQYFDAAGAGGLADAMKAVVAATAISAPPEIAGQDFQTITIRVKMDTRTLALPEDITIYGNDIALGTLTDDTAVIPGLLIEMPFGPITLRAEGAGIVGDMLIDITDQTEIIDLTVTGTEADYVIWREGQLPVLPLGTEQLVLLKNTTGIDRSSFYRSYLYPTGSSDIETRIRAGNIGPDAGIYNAVRVPSPDAPGDYELVPTGTDGTEYARIPISFAATIDPVWQGTRTVEVGDTFDANWAGSSNRRDGFQFWLDSTRITRTTVDNMTTDTGFKLKAPDKPGLYDLVFVSSFENSLGSKTTDMGQIAVGVPMPEDNATPIDPIAPEPPVVDFDTEAFDAEIKAMGGEEFPLIPIGALHGDWRLVSLQPAGAVTLIRTQINHAEKTPLGDGGLVVDASPGWGFGPTGGFGNMTLEQVAGDALTMTIMVQNGTFTGTMSPTDLGWTGDVEMADGAIRTLVLARPHDLATAQANDFPDGIDHQLIAVDERGEKIAAAIAWSMQSSDMAKPDTFQSDGSSAFDTGRSPGSYHVTATSGDLVGRANFTFGRQERRANFVVMRPLGEGADLAISAHFYCTKDEDCDMAMRDVPVDFTLPVGWGAERPLGSFNRQPIFNMSKNTASGPFFATMNERHRMADLGPCFDLVSGTFCHDKTDDAALLADIATIKQSLSFQPARRALIGDEYDTILRQLTGNDQ